jgi:hypothetical protein
MPQRHQNEHAQRQLLEPPVKNRAAIRTETMFIVLKTIGDRRPIQHKLFAKAENVRRARIALCIRAFAFSENWSAYRDQKEHCCADLQRD